MIELKPCPFCGGEAVLIDQKIEDGHGHIEHSYGVQCGECFTETPVWFSKGEYAAEMWNRRVNDDTMTDRQNKGQE